MPLRLVQFILFLAFTCTSPVLWGMERAQGWCERGGSVVVAPASVGGNPTSRGFQQSYKNCTVTVYLTGTATKATIYSNATGTGLGNPFTADQYGLWFFYAANGRYDVQISGGGPPALSAPYTFGDVWIIDPQDIGGVRYADTFPGADACLKIRAAVADLPSSGGTVDARGLQGTQACSVNPYGTPAYPVTLLLGAALYQTNVPWIIPNKSSLLGIGRGDASGVNSTIQAKSGTFATNTPVVQLCSTGVQPCFGVQVEHLAVDCAGITGCVGGENDYSQEQSWFRDVLVINSPGACFSQDIGTNSTSASQNSGPYNTLECNPGAAAVSGTVCFRVNLVPAWHGINGLTCDAAGYTSIPTNGIYVTGTAPGNIANVHIEHWTNGVVLGGAGASAGVSDIVVQNLETGPDNPTSVLIAAAGSSGKQNILISGVQNSTAAGNVLVDNCNSVTLSATTAGLGTYATGYGACGSQTVFTTRKDAGVNLQTSVNVLKSLTVPGTITGADDGSLCFGPGLPFCLYAHESATAGVPGPVVKTQNNGILVQNSQVTAGAIGGGLALNGNGFGTDAAVGQVGAGATSDTGTFTARASTAAAIQFIDGVTYFLNNSGLTPGNTFSPVNTWRIEVNGMLRMVTPIAFASLGTPSNGTIVYCNNCTNASNPCTGSGTGAFAKRLNGAWDCR